MEKRAFCPRLPFYEVNNMKKIRVVKALALMLVLAFCLSAFAACGDETPGSSSAEAAYRVVFKDAAGKAYSQGIVVKFMQNGQQAAMQMVNESGVAEKTMPRGDYTVELQFTEGNYIYDNSDMTLTADKTELTVLLSQPLSEETQELSVGTAHYVSEGCTNITLDAENRSYFIFTPRAVGKYEVSLINAAAPIGYYGGSVHYVWDHSAVEVVDNKFSVDIKAGQLGGAIMIIGVDAGEGDAILSVQNIGDPDWSVEDEPWTIYNPTVEIKPYTLPAGAKLNKFDIKAPTETYNLVLNENDGFYHLNSADGALVVVVLGENAKDTEYVPPFETILDKQGVRRYFFDEEGNFLKKEEYSECVLKYIENMDEASGVYPLTADLMYIIQQHGTQAGWFDDAADNARYLFLDQNGNRVVGVNSEISWLFMCRYL